MSAPAPPRRPLIRASGGIYGGEVPPASPFARAKRRSCALLEGADLSGLLLWDWTFFWLVEGPYSGPDHGPPSRPTRKLAGEETVWHSIWIPMTAWRGEDAWGRPCDADWPVATRALQEAIGDAMTAMIARSARAGAVIDEPGLRTACDGILAQIGALDATRC